MRRHYKPLLLILLLACAVLLLASCTEEKDYKNLVEEELIPTLERIEGAYYSPSSYFGAEYKLSIEDARGALSLYLEDDSDMTRAEAQEVYSVIKDYIEYARKLESDLLTYTKRYYAD